MAKLTPEQRARYQARYLFDNRRRTNDPETEGYGYDHDQMFLDLLHAETDLSNLLAHSVCPDCHQSLPAVVHRYADRLVFCSHPYHALRQSLEEPKAGYYEQALRRSLKTHSQ